MPAQPAQPAPSGDRMSFEEHVRNSRFIILFSATAPTDDAERLAWINSVAEDYGATATYAFTMFNGAWVITLNAPLAPEQTAAFIGELDASPLTDYAHSDDVAQAFNQGGAEGQPSQGFGSRLAE